MPPVDGAGEPGSGQTAPAAPPGPSRRSLLAGLVLAAAGALVGPPRWTAQAAAAVAPIDPATALLQAYVSTLVPGPGDDPSGTPGGVEAGGVEAILEHAPYVVPLLVSDLTAVALAAHGCDFASLAYSEREALLVGAFADGTRSPYHLIALALGAGAFYGDLRNHVGSAYLGLPSASDGYLATFTDRTGHGQPEGEAVPA
jgi:hypothetical protein